MEATQWPTTCGKREGRAPSDLFSSRKKRLERTSIDVSRGEVKPEKEGKSGTRHPGIYRCAFKRGAAGVFHESIRTQNAQVARIMAGGRPPARAVFILITSPHPRSNSWADEFQRRAHKNFSLPDKSKHTPAAADSERRANRALREERKLGRRPPLLGPTRDARFPGFRCVMMRHMRRLHYIALARNTRAGTPWRTPTPRSSGQ